MTRATDATDDDDVERGSTTRPTSATPSEDDDGETSARASREESGDDVRALVAWSVVPFRRPSHPLFMAGANYDRRVAKLANAVVEKEQTKWREVNTPIPRGALEERLGRYCASQVKAMHAEHYEKA